MSRVARPACHAPTAAFSFKPGRSEFVQRTFGGRMRHVSHFTVSALLLGWVLLPPRVPAQETASDSLLTVDHYLDWEQAGDPQVSPDGKSIAFAMLVPDSTAWKISMPQAPQGAKWTPSPRVVDELHYRQDRVGFMKQGFTHLFLVPAEGGTPRRLTSGHWNVGARFDGLSARVGYDWTPDGKTLVFDGLRDTTWDGQYRVSRIYALDVATGAIRGLVSRPGFWADPAVSPDGRTIAFTGYDSSEHTHRTSDLYAMGIDGSGMRDLSKSLDRDPGDLTWASDGKAIYFTAPDRGAINVHVADVTGGVHDVTQG